MKAEEEKKDRAFNRWTSSSSQYRHRIEELEREQRENRLLIAIKNDYIATLERQRDEFIAIVKGESA